MHFDYDAIAFQDLVFGVKLHVDSGRGGHYCHSYNDMSVGRDLEGEHRVLSFGSSIVLDCFQDVAERYPMETMRMAVTCDNGTSEQISHGKVRATKGGFAPPLWPSHRLSVEELANRADKEEET